MVLYYQCSAALKLWTEKSPIINNAISASVRSDVPVIIYPVDWSLKSCSNSTQCSSHPAVWLQGLHNSPSNGTLKVVLLTCMHSINMPQLHMSASNWKSDIGLTNLNNLQRNAAHGSCFQLSQMYRPASVHEGKIAQYKEWYWEFLKHFTDLSWLILGCFFKIILVAFLLCWTATAGSDRRDSIEGKDDMQQRSQGGDAPRTSMSCQDTPSMLISILQLANILHLFCNFFDLHLLFFCQFLSVSNL